jgi:hypothetical protein
VGNAAAVATLKVQPRPTPAERPDAPVDVEVDEALTVFVNAIEDWTAPRPGWELTVREGHEFGRVNNVEVELLLAAGEQSSSLRFRLDQVERADEVDVDEFLLAFEERDGIAKTARLTPNSLGVELFHILTFT